MGEQQTAVYRGIGRAYVAGEYQRDAQKAAGAGFVPVSESWREENGEWLLTVVYEQGASRPMSPAAGETQTRSTGRGLPLPRWRKATWALVIWTGLMLLWVVTGVSAVGNMSPAGSQVEQAGRAVGAGIGVTFIVLIWFVGFIVLALVWLMSRPKDNVVVYGPQGQQIRLSEKEARRRVEREGWSYRPPSAPG